MVGAGVGVTETEAVVVEGVEVMKTGGIAIGKPIGAVAFGVAVVGPGVDVTAAGVGVAVIPMGPM